MEEATGPDLAHAVADHPVDDQAGSGMMVWSERAHGTVVKSDGVVFSHHTAPRSTNKQVNPSGIERLSQIDVTS